jgi:hypothetical protein
VQCNHQFNLVMQLRGAAGKWEPSAADNRVSRFAEEKWLLATRIAAHLARVIGVVAPHTVDAPHRESLRRPGDGKGGYVRLGKRGHEISLCQRSRQLLMYSALKAIYT